MSAVDLTNALGGRMHGRDGMARCPAHDDRSPSLSVRDSAGGALLVHCHAGCEQRQVIAALQELRLWPGRAQTQVIGVAEQEQGRTRREKREHGAQRRAAFIAQTWRQTWDNATAARGSPIEAWLRTRGIPLDQAKLNRLPLRWSPNCPRGREAVPAMLALMTHAVTAEPSGIHRTFLLPDGSAKAFGKDSRMMLGGAGVIRLSPDDEVCQGLGICEGIETGLAIMAAGWRPIWAAGSLGALRQFSDLIGIEWLTIFADPKPHEVAGARECAKRWSNACRKVTIRIPRGGDWNDVLETVA